MKSTNWNNPKITIDPNMKSHRNDPFIVKKTEEARKTIERVGLPTELLKIVSKKK